MPPMLRQAKRSGGIVRGGTMNDSTKTSHEREINRKLDALKAALVVTMRIAWLTTDRVDLSDEIIAAKVALEKGWKEEKKEGQHG